MELRPYDIELLRGEMQRYPLEETVVIKKELLEELLTSYEAAGDSSARIEELEEEVSRLEEELEDSADA